MNKTPNTPSEREKDIFHQAMKLFEERGLLHKPKPGQHIASKGHFAAILTMAEERGAHRRDWKVYSKNKNNPCATAYTELKKILIPREGHVEGEIDPAVMDIIDATLESTETKFWTRITRRIPFSGGDRKK